MKYIVIAAFVAILASLGFALFFMMRRDNAADNAQKSRHMARALALRVGFSIALFAVILLSYWMGWIQPTGLPLR